MKRFEIITEADARVLARGETVELATGGLITPLAKDTLRERRVVVVEAGRASADATALAPCADIRSLAVGSDHTGVVLRRSLVAWLRGRGLAVDDLGTDGTEAVDYPDIAARVARAVARQEADAGIVIDASGIGSAIVANKIPGVRAAMAVTGAVARYARAQGGTNVLTLGASLLTSDEAAAVVAVWLGTAMSDAVHIGRLAKIRDLER